MAEGMENKQTQTNKLLAQKSLFQAFIKIQNIIKEGKGKDGHPLTISITQSPSDRMRSEQAGDMSYGTGPLILFFLGMLE